MAVRIPLPVTETAIEITIHSWIDLLAQEKYLEACNFSLHNPYYAWTPTLLEQTINGYGIPYEHDNLLPKCKVTPRFTAVSDKQNRYKQIEWHPPKPYMDAELRIIGYVHYDLPIDGLWSDLTATFRIIQAADYVTLELNEIHVL